MYDKVKFWINREDMAGAFSAVPNLLTKATEQTDRETGEFKVFGSLDALKVSIFCSGISIIGSLSKYYYPNSIYPLDRHTTKQAIVKLSDALRCDMNKANVTGLEFGSVLLLSHPVHEYLARLGAMPYPFCRYHFEPGTLYYRTRAKEQPITCAFYDKILEAKKSGLSIPTGFESQNLLKYEIRFNRRLPKLLNVAQVKASTLTDKYFYRMLLENWKESYFKINRQTKIKTEIMCDIQTVSDAYSVFVARLLAGTNKSVVEDFLQELKGSKVFRNRSDYNRLKNKIRDVSTKAGLVVSDELVKELDDAVKNAAAFG